jgi:translocation and assembly module TamB
VRKRIILAILALLIVIPIALVNVLVYTESGVELLARQLNKLERFGVKIEGISGTLAGPLRIRRFELNNPNVHIVTHDIVLYLEFREVWLQVIRVSSLTAHDTLVEARSAPPIANPKPPRFLPSFMRINARGLDFDKLHYVNINGMTVDADRLRAEARISPSRLRVTQFQIDAPQFNLSGKAELRAQRPLALELTTSGHMRMERGTDLVADAQLSGTIDKLAMKAQLKQPDVAHVDVTMTRPENRWRIAGTVRSPAFSLEPWLDRPPFSLRHVALRVDINPDRIHVAGNVGVPEYDSRDFTIDAQGKFAARVLRLDSADLAIAESDGRIHANGTITFDGAAPTLDVAARWTDLQWPLHGNAVASSPNGDLTLRGPLPYDYTLNAHVAVPRAAEGDAVARGVLSKEELTVSDYALQTLDGSINGAASLQFKEPRAWSLSTHAIDINPVHLHREFPGRLTFAADAKGKGLNKNATFSVKLASLKGRLREQPVRGSGAIERNARVWRIQNAQLSMGSTQLALNGTLGDTLDAQWSLQAESLQTLLPQAHGKVDFKGSAKGPLMTPHVIADLHAQDLRYQSWRVTSLTLNGDVDLAGANPSRLSLQAQHAGREAPLLESLSVKGDGNAAEHRIAVTGVGVPGPGRSAPRVDLQVVGHYVREIWTAVVTASNIETGTIKDKVSIAAPANVVVARDRASLDDLCLALGNGRFCANGKWQRNGPWEATVSGYELPLAALLPPSGDQGEYAGRIEGRIHAFGAPNKPWQGEAGLRIIDAAIIYRPQGAEPEMLNLGTGGVAATATSERIELSLGLQAFTDTFLYANGRIVRNGSNDLLHLPLTGDVRLRAADANILPIVFPEIDHAAGVLSANANIHGTLAAPQIDGRVELAHGEFDSYRVNLALRELNLVANLAVNGMDFKGSARAGDGQLDVGGQFAWRGGVSRGELQLRGQNLLVADLPEYHVVASPDLKFLIDGRNIKATGELTIPSARIQPVNLSGAVQPSEDARYVGETEAETAGRLIVDSQIRVKMGEDVLIDSFGLQGKITGGVETIVRTGDQPIGRGELSVIEGRYEAYGQKLAISRGRLLFDNSPLDDPGLDIEARRKVEAIEVGLNVRGTLRAPRLTFFSDPSMPQTQIVSYLLVGKPIDTMQSGGTASVSSASDTLALQGGGVLASQLGRRLGLDEVGVESTVGTAGQAAPALVLGKFLSPRLFISYGISLTESINTLKLRYTISDKWILKTEAGENQSLDVEYTIQK